VLERQYILFLSGPSDNSASNYKSRLRSGCVEGSSPYLFFNQVLYVSWGNKSQQIQKINNLRKKLLKTTHSVLRPGPARRVNPGPGRPGPVAGPGLSKKQAGNWPCQTRSTRRVDPGPGRPGQTRLRPGFIFFIFLCPKRRRFGLLQLKGQNNKSKRRITSIAEQRSEKKT